ncbi:MAG TPA: carbohydrate ABC transporter permease [Egibacteraceae bacterium]|nr:carbohydrate ABC transporter permease [Egibacteraceae bacterium]
MNAAAPTVAAARMRRAEPHAGPTAGRRLRTAAPHLFLVAYTMVALGPILLVIMNSLKSRAAIFGSPFAPPSADTFSLVGYSTAFQRANFGSYYVNSLVVTVSALALVLVLGSMAAFALSEYRFRGSTLLFLYLSLGIMIPIRLGTVSILRLMRDLGLLNTRLSLILVYTAMGLPLAVFILSQFMRQVPGELKEAGRVDGASEFWVYRLVIPLIRPGLAAVAIFTMLPVWNDLWFPLILAPGESTKTVTLGAQAFLGQFVSDWNAVLAALTIAMVPVMALYLIFSKQFVRGITAGAVK